MAKIIPYNPALKQLARQLRKNMTFGEVLLWNEIKENKILGFDFDRQRCIDNYIVDFYCKDLILAIEIDGQSHNHQQAFDKDGIRQDRLESLGVHFLRFTEADVKYEMPNVLRCLEAKMIAIVKNNPGIKLPESFDMKLLKE